MNKLLFLTLSLLISQTITCMNIWEAVREGDVGRVQELLDAGADINARADSKFNHQWTPLHFAAASGDINVVSELLKRGADIHACDCHQHTPLHFAAERGYVNIVSELLKAGADINARDEYQWTPLHSAAKWRHVNVVSELLKRGADINARDEYQWTPLYIAAKWRYVNVEKLLHDWPYYKLKQIRDKKGLLAFYCAQLDRCGQDSPARNLPPEMFFEIFKKLVPLSDHTIEQIHKIAEQERVRG